MEDTGTAVRLPDGSYVTVHTEPQPWWEKDQGAGYIDPNLLAPDPNQPRRSMSKHLLGELQTAIEAGGVREPITVTPINHAPWVTVDTEHTKRPFVIVSGHRRQLCAVGGGLRAVPIRVKLYPTETAHRNDAALLNGQREDMSVMDIARDVRRRLDSLGERAAAIAASYGKNNINWVHDRNGLNNLAPEMQLMLDPELPRPQQLPIVVAIKLGTIKKPSAESIADFCNEHDLDLPKEIGESDEDRAHTMQRLLLQVSRAKKLTAQTAMELIDNTRRRSGGGSRHERVDKYRPSKRIEILANYLNAITQGIPTTWSDAEFTRIFGNSDPNDIAKFLKRTAEAASTIAKLTEHLDACHRRKPRITDETLQILAKPLVPIKQFIPDSGRSLATTDPEAFERIAAQYTKK